MTDAMGWIRRVPLGPVAAALLGSATGFVAWAVPAQLLGRVVRHLHLAGAMPAAMPPYSPSTRIAGAVLAAALVGVAVLLAFRRLEARGGVEPEYDEADMPSLADRLPVLRRGDRHPDAPARRPLFAGELLPATPFAAEPADEPAAAAGPAAPPAPPTIIRAPLFEPAPPPVVEVMPPAEQPALPVEEAAVPRPVADRAAAPAPAPHPARAPTAGASVAELMARLEAGLARHTATASPPPVPLGDALRDALADLQQLARR